MGTTRIEWTDGVWNVVTGCSPISAGCQNCYAKRMAMRLAGRCGYPPGEPFRVTLHPERMQDPLHWRKPRRVFVVSMGDLFHEDVPSEFIDRVLAVVALCPQHTFQCLSKRANRMAEYFAPDSGHLARINTAAQKLSGKRSVLPAERRPLNLWLGTTVENQAAADERIPHLLRCPAAVRFVSCEPLLGPLEIFHLPPLTCEGRRSCLPVTGPAMVAEDWGRGTLSLFPGIEWCIVGPETGPGRRPCDPEWIRGIVDQCRATGVACFVKAFPIGNRISKDMAEWPKWARVREFPRS